MGNHLRDQLLARHGVEARRFLDELPEVQGRAVDVLDAAALESRQNLDPWAARRADLDVILRGKSAENGGLQLDAAAAVIGPFNDEIHSASERPAPETEFRLVGVSRGSAILHLEPVSTPEADSAMTIPTDSTPVSEAVNAIMDLHDRFEQQVSGREIHSRANIKLLRSAKALIDQLNAHGLDMEIRWRPPLGQVRRSHLTSSGKRHAAELFEAIDSTITGTLVGYVHGVNLTTGLTLSERADGGKKKHVAINREQLAVLRLNLGERIEIQVDSVSKTDKAGVSTVIKHTYVKLLDRD
jgi:hypothetical protein